MPRVYQLTFSQFEVKKVITRYSFPEFTEVSLLDVDEKNKLDNFCSRITQDLETEFSLVDRKIPLVKFHWKPSEKEVQIFIIGTSNVLLYKGQDYERLLTVISNLSIKYSPFSSPVQANEINMSTCLLTFRFESEEYFGFSKEHLQADDEYRAFQEAKGDIVFRVNSPTTVYTFSYSNQIITGRCNLGLRSYSQATELRFDAEKSKEFLEGLRNLA